MLGPSSHFSRRLLTWYDANRRDLPWRRSPSAYRVLVSEAMLQQTQVATVIPYFHRFIERFSTIQSLANAPEQDVLRLWQGLGYYARARNLQRAAQAIVEHHGGEVPRTVEQLKKLPGIGRYTAGAVASIAYNVRAPIVDGNVARVICRLDKIDDDPRHPKTLALLWKRAEEILPRRRVGDFNSALMELGATVCMPRSPQCLICPVRAHCQAFEAGVQNEIPRPRVAKVTPMHRRDVFCISDRSSGVQRWLIEQRPAKGRWAGMWQFVTVESNGESKKRTAQSIGHRLSLHVTLPRKIGTATHALTHRRYTFDVYRCDLKCAGGKRPSPRPSPGVPGEGEIENGIFEKRRGKSNSKPSIAITRPRRWVTVAELDKYPLPRPHLNVIQMLDLT